MKMLSSSYLLVLGCLCVQTLAGLIHGSNSFIHLRDTPEDVLQHSARQDSSSSESSPSLLSNATTSDLDAARLIVKDAIANMTILNKARLDNPTRNQYSLKPGTKYGRRADSAATAPPLLNITAEIARAAALVADAEAQASSNSSSVLKSKRAGTFWMESISRKGTVPWGNDASYKASLS